MKMRRHSIDCIFSEVSSEYATYRASYSKLAIDKILEGLDNPSQLMTVDLGAGTGIGSRQLAEKGLKVIAIEPDPAMIQFATPHPLIEFQANIAEVTQLPDDTADLVTCFTAFHWFDFEHSLREIQRILKPSGRLALIWNHWDTGDPFSRCYKRLVRRAGRQSRARITPYDKFPSGLVKAARILLLWNRCLIPNFQNVVRYRFTHQQTVDLAKLIGCASSYSFPLEKKIYQQLVRDLKTLIDRSQAPHRLVYKTTLFLAEPKIKVW